jgi:hypothetical protein
LICEAAGQDFGYISGVNELAEQTVKKQPDFQETFELI